MDGFQLNKKFIRWDDLPTASGTTTQEIAALGLIKTWVQGSDTFRATTSGSTGPPKPIKFSRELATYSAECTNRHFGLDASDHVLVCMDCEKIAGKMMIIRALVGNMSLTIIEPQRNPAWVGPYTFTSLAPIQLESLLQEPLPTEYKCILVGGAPVSHTLAAKVEDSGLPVFETFGMTETLSHIAVRPVCNRPDPFEIIQEITLATDEQDCLSVQGKITNGQILFTNDRIELLDEKRFKWLGRTDFVINSGGIKIQPETIEYLIQPVIAKQFNDASFFVFGVPHPEYGETPVLILEGDFTISEEWLDELKTGLPSYHAPRGAACLPEFKYASNGKIRRKETAALLPLFAF